MPFRSTVHEAAEFGLTEKYIQIEGSLKELKWFAELLLHSTIITSNLLTIAIKYFVLKQQTELLMEFLKRF